MGKFLKGKYGLGAILSLIVLAFAGAIWVTASNSTWAGHTDTSWYDPTYTTYYIDTEEKLAGVAELVNNGTTSFSGKILEIGYQNGDPIQSLDLQEHYWIPIGTKEKPFQGILSGKAGHIVEIKGMRITGDHPYAGLIGYMENGALVSGLSFTNGTIEIQADTDVYAGAAVGKMLNHSTAIDITNSIPITVASKLQVFVGGIVGSGDNGLISRSSNNGEIAVQDGANKTFVGGILGYSDNGGVKIKEVLNSQSVTVFGNKEVFAGGIAGYAHGSINMEEQGTNIRNSGSVVINEGKQIYAGGIVGKAFGKVSFSEQTSNSGTVSINSPESNYTSAGGLLGAMGSGLATDALVNIAYTNSVKVTNNGGTTVYTGGIVGSAEDDIYFQAGVKNTGEIEVSGQEAYTGGLIGYVQNQLFFEDSSSKAYVNSGTINVTSGTGLYTGGIVGNRAYTRTIGDAASIQNVESIGAIQVSGSHTIFTGGYIGKMTSDAIDKGIFNASFQQNITVAAPNETSQVYTGGIVGYVDDPNAVVENSHFQGKLQVTGGDSSSTITGGIVGGLVNGTIQSALVGTREISNAEITADGTIGGVAGLVQSPSTSLIDGANVQQITLTVTTNNGIVGGIAGILKGKIAHSTVGNPTTPNLVIQAAAEKENLTAGGIAGVVVPEAIIGESEVPTNVKIENIKMDIKAPNSNMGGAIGVNQSPNIFLLVNNLKLDVDVTPVNVGGVIGRNQVAIDLIPVPTEIPALNGTNISIHTAMDQVQIGGLIGENIGGTSKNTGKNIKIYSEGNQNKLGGTVGLNKGTIQNSMNENVSITAKGLETEAGGIAGRSIGTAESIAKISDSRVEEKGDPFITVSGIKSRIGGMVGYAERTEVINPQVKAVTPNVSWISILAADVQAGGIAGFAKSSNLVGDKNRENVSNLFITTGNNGDAAAKAFIGGIAGFNEETRIDKMIGTKIDLRISGKESVVGGIAGFNKGTDKAIIKDSYVLELKLDATNTAMASMIGGMVGKNAERTIDSQMISAQTGVSSIQGSRSVGALKVEAPSAITGGLVGENHTLIANNSIADKIPVTSLGSNSKLGGLVGLNAEKGTVYYTYSNANLTIEGQGTFAGGLVGANNGHVLSSYVDMDVIGRNYSNKGDKLFIGGLVGKNTGNIDKSYTKSKIAGNANNSIVGGLVGYQESGKVENSYVGKEVLANGKGSYAGGFIGEITGGTVEKTYSAAEVKGTNNGLAGGFAGLYNNSKKTLLVKNYYRKDADTNADLSDFADGDYRWLNAPTRLSTLQADVLQDRNVFPALSEWDFVNTWRYGSPNAAYQFPELNRIANSGGEENSDGDVGNIVNANINWYVQDKGKPSYEIKTEAELAGLAAIVNGMIPGLDAFNFENRTIQIMNPIQIQSNQWVPIGHTVETAFEGSFEGNNQLIHGLKVLSEHHYDYIGLFGVIGTSGKVNGVRLEADSIKGKGDTGALAGFNKGTVSNTTVTLLNKAIISGQTVGGMFGRNAGMISNLNFTLDGSSRVEAIADGAIVGGIIGENSSSIVPSTYTFNRMAGSVGSSKNNAIIGGIIGKQTGDVSGVTVDIFDNYTVSATGSNNILGGVIGHFVSGKAENLDITFKDGFVKGTGTAATVGAVIGKSDATNTINNVIVSTETAETTAPQVTGTGVVGGLVGDKTGKGIAAFDITNVKIENVWISTVENSNEDVVLGGIAGTLTNTALHQGHFDATVHATSAHQVTAGGIVGKALDSILYDVVVLPNITSNATATNRHIIGGVAGIMESADRDIPFDFNLSIPLYKGIYKANVYSKSIQVNGKDQNADLYVGGIVGQNNQASIYFTSSSSPIMVENGQVVYIGGVAGFNDNGIIVSTKANNDIHADLSANYHVGGVVGRTISGEIHYTNVESGKVKIGTIIEQSGLDPATYAGGFIGTSDETHVTNSFANIPLEINCTNLENIIYAGGFAGYLDSSSTKGSMERIYAKGNLLVSGKVLSYVGGFSGYVDRYLIHDAYATGDINNTGYDTRSGGFAAVVEREAVIKNAQVKSNAIKTTGINHATRSYVGGFAGYNDGQLDGIKVEVKTRELNVTGANAHNNELVGYNFRNGVVKVDAVFLPFGEWNIEPDATILLSEGDGEWLISDDKQLTTAVLLMNDNVTNLKYYRLFNRAATSKLAIHKLTLQKDIQIEEGKIWIPIAKFEAGSVFNGADKKIAGVTAGYETANGYSIRPGIYAEISQDKGSTGFILENAGTVTDVILDRVTINGDSKVGSVAAVNTGVINNVTVEGTIKGNKQVGGIAGVNKGVISNLNVTGTVHGLEYIGGVAGVNHKDITSVTVTGSIKGTEQVGGIAGKNTAEGSIKAVTNDEVVVEGSTIVGGIVGENAGMITNGKVVGTITATGTTVGGVAGINHKDITNVFVSGSIKGIENVGGIAGKNTAEGSIKMVTNDEVVVEGSTIVGGIVGENAGMITDGKVVGTITATGATVGGVAGVNHKDITNVTITGSIEGTEQVGGVAGQNTANSTISNLVISESFIKGINEVGGIAGYNAGRIEDTGMMGSITSTGSFIGGIAGRNEGEIRKSFMGGTLQLTNPDSIVAGGIAGDNVGSIEESFSYSDITATSKLVKIGGIAGISSGEISDVYNSGLLKAKGFGSNDVKVWSGGIVGHAQAGRIMNALNYAEVMASIGDKIIPQQSFFGGIVGQNSGAVVTNSAFNKQMLKVNTAYYDTDEKRVGGDAEHSKGMLASNLTDGTLPLEFDGDKWDGNTGFYPSLKGFHTDITKLSTAAIILHEYDVVNRVARDFSLTEDDALIWTSNPAIATTGSLKGSKEKVILTATVNGLNKNFILNEKALLFIDQAAKPTTVTDPVTPTFQDKVTVTLLTEELGGEIYYTLDGSIPYPNEGTTLLYTGPIELSETTTIKAILFVADKEPSDVITQLITKQVQPIPGGGGGAPMPTPTPLPVPEPNVIINGQPIMGEVKNGVIEATFTLDDLKQATGTKEIVVTGKVTEAIGYVFHFDETVKGYAIKEQKNIIIELPQARLVITPKMMEEVKEAIKIIVTQNTTKALSEMKAISDSVNASLLVEGKGVTIESNLLTKGESIQLVPMTISLPDGIKANEITAVVLKDQDGNWTTVPWKQTDANDEVTVLITGEGTISFLHKNESFADVKVNYWGRTIIDEAASKLFVLGKSPVLFDPESKVTRAQFPTILLRVAGLMNQNASEVSFMDIKENDGYMRSIAIASELGIVTGVSPTTYEPNKELTRLQGMVMVGRMLDRLGLVEDLSDEEVEKLLFTFKDGKSIPAWARKAAAITIKNGIIIGSNQELNPQKTLTRAQAAAIAIRLNQIITE
jgi:hypothetical protein